MPAKPVSRFGKLMDYVRRPEYLSANIAEYVSGKSPYKNWYEAAWKGFSGQRRVDYIDLTGNPIVGLALGIALDPLTYIPFGATTKIAKATRLPGAVGKLARIAGRRWPVLQKTGASLRFLIGDPAAKLKWISGFDKAVDTMRVKGVGDDFIKAIKTAGELSDEMAAVASKAGVLGEAKTVAEISRVISQGLEVPGKLTALKASMIDEYADMARWFSKLMKENPKKAKAMLDLFEKSLPEKMVTLGQSKVVWGMGDEFMGALKKIGVTQDEINEVLARVTRPVVGADDAYRMKAAYSYMDDINGTIKHLRDFPDHYRLPEFQELMDLAMSKLDPEAADLFKRAQYVQSQLVNRAVQKRLLDAKMLDQFAQDLGLNYLPHLTAPQNYKRLRSVLIKRGKASFDELLGLSRKYKGQIVDEKLLKELMDADNYDNVIEVLTGVDRAGLRKAGVSLEDIDQLTRIQNSMTQFRKVEGGLTDIAARLEAEAGKKGAKLFEMNLPKLLFEQEIRMRSAFLYQSYIKKLLKQYENTPLMKKVEEGIDVAGEIATRDMVRITDKLVGDFLVHKDLAHAFESCIKITTGRSKDFQKFLRMYDKGLGMWKYGTLIPFGKFHIRNLMSEMLLNNIAGMWLTDPAYVEAAKLLKAVKAGDKAARYKYYELIRKGVIKTGFFASEIGGSKKLITPMWKRVTGMKGMENLGEFTEDFPRIAMHIWASKKGVKFAKKMGFNSVDDMVRKFHPVYDRFTPFEKGVMKRIFPFYSWSRFNLPLHAEMFVQNPKHYAQIERARHAITQLRGGQMPDEIDPEWIREGYVVGWSKKPGKRTYLVLRGWLPHADLGELLAKRGMQDLVTRQLTPVKTLGEVFFGYDLFKKRSLPAYPGEKTTVLGAKVASRYAHLLSPIRVYQEVNRFFFGSEDKYWDRVVFHLFGRAYTIDEEKAKRQLKYDMGKAIGELKFGIKRAKQNQDYGTMKKLEQQKIKLERAVKKL